MLKRMISRVLRAVVDKLDSVPEPVRPYLQDVRQPDGELRHVTEAVRSYETRFGVGVNTKSKNAEELAKVTPEKREAALEQQLEWSVKEAERKKERKERLAVLANEENPMCGHCGKPFFDAPLDPPLRSDSEHPHVVRGES